MTVAAPGTTCSRSGKKEDAAILLSSDDGGWTLTELDHPARQFPNFEDALEGARQVPDWTKSTIEIWRGGQYICYLPPQAWRPRPKASIHAPPQRYLNAAAAGVGGFAMAATTGQRLAAAKPDSGHEIGVGCRERLTGSDAYGRLHMYRDPLVHVDGSPTC